MNWLDKLERRFGYLAVPGLIRMVVGFNGVVFVMALLNPALLNVLTLDPERVMAGEVWRLVSYLFIPPTLSPLWVIFALYMLWLMGEGLEREWGSFKLTLFYVVGMVATTVVAFFIFHGPLTNTYLNLSVFLAFATIFPDFEILLFFILPVKVKYLGLLSGALIFWTILNDPLSAKLAAVVSIGNYLLFFAPHFWRTAVLNREVAQRRAEFVEKARGPEQESWHRCAVCGKTELVDREMDFRVADDGKEYCTEHLAQSPTRQKAEGRRQ